VFVAPRRVDDLADRDFAHVARDHAIDQAGRILSRQPIFVQRRDIDQRRRISNRVVFVIVMRFIRADRLIA
jgi:hypothetical protein